MSGHRARPISQRVAVDAQVAPLWTILPFGTYFRFTYKGKQDYGLIKERGFLLLVPEQVPVGATVHKCVWVGKGRGVLESRGTEVKR